MKKQKFDSSQLKEKGNQLLEINVKQKGISNGTGIQGRKLLYSWAHGERNQELKIYKEKRPLSLGKASASFWMTVPFSYLSWSASSSYPYFQIPHNFEIPLVYHDHLGPYLMATLDITIWLLSTIH